MTLLPSWSVGTNVDQYALLSQVFTPMRLASHWLLFTQSLLVICLKQKETKLNPNSVCVEISIEDGDKMSENWTGW